MSEYILVSAFVTNSTKLKKLEKQWASRDPKHTKQYGRTKKQTKIFKKWVKENIPLNRLAKISDISNLVLFLSSNKSNYITGQTIVIDGGYTIN